MCGYGLSESTVGIIGLGRIGKCGSGARSVCSGGVAKVVLLVLSTITEDNLGSPVEPLSALILVHQI